MQERAKGAQHIYQSQNRKEKHLETQNEPKPSPRQEPKKLSAILADNQTDLNAIDDENTNPLFDELANKKGQITP